MKNKLMLIGFTALSFGLQASAPATSEIPAKQEQSVKTVPNMFNAVDNQDGKTVPNMFNAVDNQDGKTVPNMCNAVDNQEPVRSGIVGEIDPKAPKAPAAPELTKFEQVKAFAQNMGRTAKSYTWDIQVGGYDVGMYTTLAVVAAALGYGIYKLAPIVKNAIVGQFADTQPVKHVRTVRRHSSNRTMRRPA